MDSDLLSQEIDSAIDRATSGKDGAGYGGREVRRFKEEFLCENTDSWDVGINPGMVLVSLMQPVD